jgi:RNA polymerase sigma factor (sigma-70 family)
LPVRGAIDAWLLESACLWHNERALNAGHEPTLAWERACIVRARAGDSAAFAELYRAFAPRLYARVLLPRLGHVAAAEDALSETFRALIEHIAELDAGERSLWSWLCRVAANKAHDMHRSKARSRRALTSFESMLAPVPLEPDATAELELRGRHAAAEQVVKRVLSALNPRYRRALELRFLEERPRDQCAALMQVKLGTFDVLLLRALRAFRRQWRAQLAPAEREIG